MSENNGSGDNNQGGQPGEPSTNGASGAGDNGGTDWQAEIEKWKSLARKHESRAKENADKAKQFDEFTERQKTEQQKLQERLEKAEREVAEVKLQALKAEIGAAKGLTPNQTKRLVGSTREELEADADEMLADLKTHRRKTDFGGGERGSDVRGGVRQWSKADLEGKSNAEIEAARKAGHLDQLMGKTN